MITPHALASVGSIGAVGAIVIGTGAGFRTAAKHPARHRDTVQLEANLAARSQAAPWGLGAAAITGAASLVARGDARAALRAFAGTAAVAGGAALAIAWGRSMIESIGVNGPF